LMLVLEDREIKPLVLVQPIFSPSLSQRITAFQNPSHQKRQTPPFDNSES
jgi:hypothetical protein